MGPASSGKKGAFAQGEAAFEGAVIGEKDRAVHDQPPSETPGLPSEDSPMLRQIGPEANRATRWRRGGRATDHKNVARCDTLRAP